MLTREPVLGFPDPQKEYILDVDASGCALGAVLSQAADGLEKVIAYGSKSLTTAERNYCVTKRELLAVVYFCRKYRTYLLGTRFRVRTDHGSLRWLLRFKEPQHQLARWLSVLAEFDFDIEHRPGPQHRNADALSRFPCEGACTQCERGDCPGGGRDRKKTREPMTEDLNCSMLYETPPGPSATEEVLEAWDSSLPEPLLRVLDLLGKTFPKVGSYFPRRGTPPGFQ